MPKREKRSLPKDGKKGEHAPSPSAQGKEFQLPEDEIGDIVDVSLDERNAFFNEPRV